MAMKEDIALWLKFSGWFQCRLAIDPDPTDEPRGVSGFTYALAGEPDLDRIIRLQSPQAPRSHCPEVGVKVKAVYLAGEIVKDHFLTGANIDLLGQPKFEGRNGIVVEAGEPILPFNLRVSMKCFAIQRAHLDEEEFPFTELQSTVMVRDLGELAEATGIWDLKKKWRERIAKLQQDRNTAKDNEKAAINTRIQVLNYVPYAFAFTQRMFYSFDLQGSAFYSDPDSYQSVPVDLETPWPIEFWLGGWDMDALCGYMQGFLGLPLKQ